MARLKFTWMLWGVLGGSWGCPLVYLASPSDFGWTPETILRIWAPTPEGLGKPSERRQLARENFVQKTAGNLPENDHRKACESGHRQFHETTGGDGGHDDDQNFQPDADDRFDIPGGEGAIGKSNEKVAAGNTQVLLPVQALNLDDQ